ncbi:hypothetical protein K431DRAFT_299296 [Polychaeton citri CBS 116435]|uniref:Mid2 domain-containing protein n=1 Tax=Polychaeton citri CBS 116435 TaxID=1314669 RepID=A0A9P4UUV4_9PEZI|nr:hypothetical protein K431DRAFT_299296 [Polychaeton citri CBS 116435]
MKLSKLIWQTGLLLAASTAAAENALEVLQDAGSQSTSVDGSSSHSSLTTTQLSTRTTSDASSTSVSATRRLPSVSTSIYETASMSSTTLTAAAVTGVSTTAAASSQPSLANQWNGGDPDGTDAGASGTSSGSFSISTGAMAAIIVIIVLVVIFVSTLALFIVAKRRQWTIRQTLKRASRRLTGRAGANPDRRPHERAARRTAVRFVGASPPMPQNGRDVPPPYQPGHKRGLVVDIDAAEKGVGNAATTKPKKSWANPLVGRGPEGTRKEGGFVGKLWGNS